MESPTAWVLADFMFAARISSALSQTGWTSRGVSHLDSLKADLLSSPPDLLIVELGNTPEPRIELIRQIREEKASVGLPILAFGSHKARSVLQAARDAGASLVVSNGTLVSRFPEVIEKARQQMDKEESRLMVDEDDE
jgi:DNA-binding NarL/FixJ family response regulator